MTGDNITKKSSSATPVVVQPVSSTAAAPASFEIHKSSPASTSPPTPVPTTPNVIKDTTTPLESAYNFIISSLLYLRYLLVRLFTIPVPFFSNKIPILGGRTVIELAMIGIAFYLGITTAMSQFKTAGIVTDYLLSITIILAFRHNVLTYFFNISFERVLFWHKAAAILSICTMIIHGYQRLSNQSGLLLGITMLMMAGSYLIKPYFFEIFYTVHVVGAILLLPFGFMHYSKIFQYLLLVWYADLIIRYFLTMKRIQAYAKLLPGNVIEIQIPNSKREYDPENATSAKNPRISYKAGQFCFIMIKEISMYEFHPFSYSTSPHEDTIKLHIRQIGNWTNKLADYIRTSKNAIHEVNPEHGDATLVPIELYHEGPYGTPMIDLDNSVYDVLLLISGGIGVTPLQSIYNHLVHESSSQRRNYRKVIFIWSIRDRDMVDAMLTNKLHSDITSTSDVPYLPITFQPPLSPPPSQVKASPKQQISPKRVIPANDTITPDHEEEDIESSKVDIPSSRDISSEYIFHNEYYMTQVRTNNAQQHIVGIHPAIQHWLKFGRPNLPEIFERTAQLCKEEKISRVGVCVCGPAPMVNETVDLCHASLLNPNCSAIRFDCHCEVFDF